MHCAKIVVATRLDEPLIFLVIQNAHLIASYCITLYLHAFMRYNYMQLFMNICLRHVPAQPRRILSLTY